MARKRMLSTGDKVKITNPDNAFYGQEGMLLGHDGTDISPYIVEIKGNRLYFDFKDLKLAIPEPLFRKDLLETGMVLTRNGVKWTVLLNTNQGDLIVTDGSSTRLTANNDTYFFGNTEGVEGYMDQVLQPIELRDYANRVNRQYNVIWQKKTPMTIEDIESKLGYRIEVVTNMVGE